MRVHQLLPHIIGIASILSLWVGCSAPTSVPALVSTGTPAPPSASAPTAAPQEQSRAEGLSDQDAASLSSLKKVDDHPLYTMRYYGSPYQRTSSIDGRQWRTSADSPTWACSLFAALGDEGNMHYPGQRDD
jgi:hypothetical protein